MSFLGGVFSLYEIALEFMKEKGIYRMGSRMWVQCILYTREKKHFIKWEKRGYRDP